MMQNKQFIETKYECNINYRGQIVYVSMREAMARIPG